MYSTVGQPYATALAELNSMKANATESAHLEILENQGVYETSFDDDDDDDEDDDDDDSDDESSTNTARAANKPKNRDNFICESVLATNLPTGPGIPTKVRKAA